MLTPVGRLKKLETIHGEAPYKLVDAIDQASSSQLTGYLRVIGKADGEKLSAIVLLKRGNPIATEVRVGEEISKGARGLDTFKNLTATSGVIEVYELTDEEVDRALRLNPETLMEATEAPPPPELPTPSEEAAEEVPPAEHEEAPQPPPPTLKEVEALPPPEAAIDIPSDLPLPPVEEAAQVGEWPESLEELELEEAPSAEREELLELPPPEEVIEDEEAAIVAQLRKITLPKKEDVKKILEREGFQT